MNSVTATPLANITVNNFDAANPTIGVAVPLNADLDLGAVDILDSTGSAGALNQVLKSNGVGNGVSWGADGGGIAAVTEGVLGNISIPNPLVPFVSVRNPLNAVLNLGTQSITGTTGSIQLVNLVATSQTTITGQQMRIQDTAVAANGILMTETGLAVSGSAGAQTLTYGSSNIVKTGGAMGITAPTALNITAGTGVNINSGTSPVQITQPVNTAPKLTTDIANVNYYADFVVDNNNSTAVVNIPPPNYNGQRLTCIARGISPITSWIAFGNDATTANPNGIFATYTASTGEVWIARTDSNKIDIWDATLTGAPIAQIAVTGGSARVYCFYEESGFMFFGGSFDNVAGTLQNGVGRVSLTAPYAPDQLLEGATTVNGVDVGTGTQGVYCLESRLGYLYAGGEFQQFTPSGAPANFIFRIFDYTLPTGSQTYDFVDGGTNAPVYALLNTGTYLFIGGDFTQVSTVFFPYAYLAVWDGFNWGFTDGNLFNAPISNLENVPYSSFIFVGGFFTHTTDAYSCYLDYNNPFAPNTATNLTLSTPLASRGATYYNGTTYVSTSADGIYSSNTQGVWVSQGTAVNATPTFMGQFGGSLNVGYSDAAGYYKQTTPSQTSTFTLTSGNFENNNIATYTSVLMSLPDTAQSWIGVDVATAPKWIQIGCYTLSPYLTYS